MDDLDKVLNTIPPEDIDQIVESVVSGEFDMKKEINERLPYTRKVSVNDLVPEEYQQKLMELDYTMSRCFWLIGDIADDLINSVNRQRAKEFGKVISHGDIFEAIGFFCHRSERAVRYYWEVSHYFPPETREKYEIPFAMFAHARWVDDWETFLNIAFENPMWSSEKVKFEYYNQKGEKLPVHLANKKEEPAGLPVLAAQLEQTDELPPADEEWKGHNFKNMLLSQLDHTIDDLRKTINKIPLPTELRVRIGDAILEINDIEAEVRRL